jgi:probable HAF family extracellular repeat protein
MKPRLIFAPLGLLVVLAMPAGSVAQAKDPMPARYTVTDLGTLGGFFTQASLVNDHGVVSGVSSLPDGTQHAVIWANGSLSDIGTPGLGGPNSLAIGVNEKGQVAVQAESSTLDPNNENFCAYFTGLECLPSRWQDGVMTQLPLLGGNNGTVNQINNRGEIAGIAENSTRDPDCPSARAVNGTGPQVLDFEAVIWGAQGEVTQLSPLRGDTVGMAMWLNDSGQAVGTSGTCANTVLPPFVVGPHAVLWEKDGSVTDLGNLGGTANPALVGTGNVAFAINNQGQVTGVSTLADNTHTHAFLWTRDTGMQDLGTLPGDVNSAGLGTNNRGDVVGSSINGDVGTGSARAILWHNGAMIDINTLAPDSPVYLLVAFGINDAGQIVGFGISASGEIHGFLATPVHSGN